MDVKVESVGSIKVGRYIIVDGIACVVKSIQIAKTGKHGHAKARIEAIGLIDNQKKIFIKPSHDKIEVPIIEKNSAQILSIHGDTANVMDQESYETFDLKIPEDLQNIKEGDTIIYWNIMGNRVMKQKK